MAKTVVGLFDTSAEAQSVVTELVDAGCRRDDISLVAQDTRTDRGYEGRTEAEGEEKSADTGDRVAAGAGIGAALGGIGGLLVGMGALAIPGIGPVVAAGPLVAALTGAGAGAVAGGLIGGLTSLGVPEHEAHAYAEGVRRGGTLVTVRTEDSKASHVAEIMNRHNPIDIDTRAAQWRTEGWQGMGESVSSAPRTGLSEDSTITPSATGMTGATGTDRDAIPLAKEELEVGKRQVARGGVRVHTHVTERPVSEDVRLRDESVDVERRPVDRPLEAGEDAFRERTVEATETDEEAVVAKRARIKEEVKLRKEVEEHEEHIEDTVRDTDVDIEHIPPGQRPGPHPRP